MITLAHLPTLFLTLLVQIASATPITLRSDLTITSRTCAFVDPAGWGNQPGDWADYAATINVMIPEMKSDLASNPGKVYNVGTDTGGGNHWICSVLPQGVYLETALYVCQSVYEPIWQLDLGSLVTVANTIVGNGNNACANRNQGVNGEVAGTYTGHKFYAYILRWHDD